MVKLPLLKSTRGFKLFYQNSIRNTTIPHAKWKAVGKCCHSYMEKCLFHFICKPSISEKGMQTAVVILTCSVRNRWLEEKERVAFGFVSNTCIIYSKCWITHFLLIKNTFLYQLQYTKLKMIFVKLLNF